MFSFSKSEVVSVEERPVKRFYTIERSGLHDERWMTLWTAVRLARNCQGPYCKEDIQIRHGKTLIALVHPDESVTVLQVPRDGEAGVPCAICERPAGRNNLCWLHTYEAEANDSEAIAAAERGDDIGLRCQTCGRLPVDCECPFQAAGDHISYHEGEVRRQRRRG